MEENKISVVINTYNAAAHLEEVLQSASAFDEIVICDMESTDDTLDIARRYDCKIVTFPKKDYVSAEPARTFAIQSASNKWVLVVDADEVITTELKDFLYATAARPDAPAGLWIPRKNYFMGRFMHSTYPDFLLRFFIREGTEWPPYVHTFPTVKGPTEKIPAKKKELALVHLADDSIKTRLEKTNLYTDNEVVKKANKNYGVGALLWRPFWRFFKSYFLKQGFLDGVPGFIYACLEGVYQFIAVSKIIEKRKTGK